MSVPWMPLYIADYLADTTHLRTVEHGAYMLLIMTYWRHGKLPADDAALARIARMSGREWQSVKGTLQALFGDDWTHKRIDQELNKARTKSNSRAEAGSRGGNAKAMKTKEHPIAKATILPEQNPTVALASSSQPQPELDTGVSNKTRGARISRSDDAELLIDFEGEFWPDYPHKVGKPDALKAFIRARKSHSMAMIMTGLAGYKRTKPDDRPWLNPATFLNQERFNDQPAASPNARAGPVQSGFGVILDEAFGKGPFDESDFGISPNGRGDVSDGAPIGAAVEILEPDRAGRWSMADRR